jgi:hypothetical protein
LKLSNGVLTRKITNIRALFSFGTTSRDTGGLNPPRSASQSSEWTVVGESFLSSS